MIAIAIRERLRECKSEGPVHGCAPQGMQNELRMFLATPVVHAMLGQQMMPMR